MKNKRFIIFALLWAFAGLQSCQKDSIGHTTTCNYTPAAHPKAQVYQALLDEYTAKGLPGISALIRDSNGVWAGASGKADIGQDIDMSPCIVSKAASVTKTFIGTLTLKLVEEGKLGLDDPLTKWLPEEVLDRVKNTNSCTIRQLMNHTTGIADIIDDSEFYLSVLNYPNKNHTPEQLIRYVYDDEPEFAPGTSVAYSNTNFLLLVMAIEKATGENHARLLRAKVLEPIGLAHSYYFWHDPLPENTAQGYFDLYNNGTIINVTNYNTGSGNGYGGLYADVFDLQAFAEALLRNKTVLQPASLQKMLTFIPLPGDSVKEHGLAIYRDFVNRGPNEYAYGHRGRDLGYTADMYWFPQKDYTLVYLINYGTDAKSKLRQVFYDFREEIVDVIMND